MWFATEDGLSRYDGNTFVVYKNNRSDPESIGGNSTKDLQEDDHGYLWIVAAHDVNKFDPTTQRFTRYRHDSSNPNSLSSNSVEDIARDSRGSLWVGTADSGVDRFDPATGTFTHYRNDSDGKFLGTVYQVIEDSHGEIWFVGERGLFHLNLRTGQITRPPGTIKGLSAGYLYEDSAGNFWMLAWSPIVGLVKYDRKKERCTEYPVGAGAAFIGSSRLLDDGGNGLWVPSSLGLFYFDLRTERFTYHFRRDETDPDSLNDNAVVQAYRDRSGLLWVATEHGGLNILNFQQGQFGRLKHRPGDPNSLSPGRVTAIYVDSDNVLWLGFFPRALDRLDRKTGRITHYVPDPKKRNALSKGSELTTICEDVGGYLWLGGWQAGLDRYDKRAGQFKHYGHNPSDPASLMSDNVLSVYEDRSGHLWVGQTGGVSRFDSATQRFVNYRTGPDTLYNTVSAIYQDRSGILWLGKWDGVVSRLDPKTKNLVNYMPDSSDPHKLQGGSISSIYQDRAGTLWVGTEVGVCRYNRQNEMFTCYAESQDLSSVSNNISGILEDGDGRLWLSTKNGISRFNPKTETFRHYDTADGLQGNEFRDRAFAQGPDGEMFFGGNTGITTFFPEDIRDNPYVPPVVITSFKIFNKPVPIGAKSVLNKATPYIHSLTLSSRDNVFSFEFAALSYANSRKNRYRYKLEGLEPAWNEVGSKQRLATYTNLDPGKYVFRVQASNSDGVWNEEGVSLPILITPPWWRTNWFRVLCAAAFLVLLWAAHQLRVRQLQRSFKRLRDVIDTIPTIVFEAGPDGSGAIANRPWHGYTGSTLRQHGRFAPEDQAWRDSTCVHPDDLDEYVKLWEQAIAMGQSFELEARVRRADGEYRSFLARHVPLRDKRGKILKWFGTFTDIEDRKRAEEERRESETRFRTFVDHAGDALFVYDLEQGTIIDVNREACESLGYTRHELIGKVPLFFHLDSYQAEMESVVKRAAAGETVFNTHWHRRKDGSTFPVEVHTSLVLYGGRRFLLKVARDISDRLQAEEQREKLRQLEADLAHINRVSMMGELTASIAHEVNQPLSGVVSNGGACLRWLAGDVPNLEEAREAARRIVRDGKRAGEVIARIRALTRKTSTPREKLDLNETIRQVLALVGDQAKKNSVLIRTHFADDLSPVSGDQVQLQQVVLNLVMNAIEAMSSVRERLRELVITSRNVDPDQVQVTVEDSGVGLDPNRMQKIFDPFYTTKPGGMGMGLSISRSILQAHGGRLWATAKEGNGTIFHVTLPKCREEEANARVAV